MVSASESDDSKWTTVENRNNRRSARNREEKLSNLRSIDSDSGSNASYSGESKGRSRAHRKRAEGAKRANVKNNMHKISSHTSSSESERSSRNRHRSRVDKTRAVKLLQGWGIKFSGENRKEDSESFLEQLEECVYGADSSDSELLAALPRVFEGVTARWFRTE